jgi:hypothetical protein
MSARNFLTIGTNGLQRLVSAIASSAGVADASKVVCTDSNGKLSLTLMPTGLDVSAQNIVADEALNSGEYINIFDEGGTRKVRKASAAAGSQRPAHGFVITGAAEGSNAVVYTLGENDQLSGLTIGQRYFLSAATAGGMAATPDMSASGNLIQVLGYATSTTSLRFEFDSPIEVG